MLNLKQGLKQVRRIGAAAVCVCVPLLQATAQTSAPTTPEPPTSTPPPAARPAPQVPDKSVTAPDKSVTAPGKIDPLLGLTVLSADGSRLGSVQRVKSTLDGKVEEIHIKTGGFLGFGSKVVAIPEAKYTRKGDTVQLQMTADEVSKLPEIKDQS